MVPLIFCSDWAQVIVWVNELMSVSILLNFGFVRAMWARARTHTHARRADSREKTWWSNAPMFRPLCVLSIECRTLIFLHHLIIIYFISFDVFGTDIGGLFFFLFLFFPAYCSMRSSFINDANNHLFLLYESFLSVWRFWFLPLDGFTKWMNKLLLIYSTFDDNNFFFELIAHHTHTQILSREKKNLYFF